MKIEQVQHRIHQIQAELDALGPIHPGSVSEQYNICGTPGCRCKDARKPQKHGPYYQLGYTWRGHHHTRFVRADQLDGVRQKVAHYKRLRELTLEWVDLAVEQERLERGSAR